MNQPDKREELNRIVQLSTPEPALMPHDIAAECAVLGGLLLDPNAIARIEAELQPAHFYLDSYRKIYSAALSIHREGRCADLMTIASELKDKGLLETAGGQKGLADLLDSVVSAANIDQYAQLIAEKAQRRALIMAGNEIARLGHDTGQKLPLCLEQAEEKVFAVTQSGRLDGLSHVSEPLRSLFDRVERNAEGDAPLGLNSGFYDLDTMTQGFQRSDLIIVAGRPSMGKTAMTLQVAVEIAAKAEEPVVFFSLEMSEEQLALRMLASDSKIDSSRLRAGRLSPDEWGKLAASQEHLSGLPVFIDDNAMTSISEIRSKCRKLKGEHGSIGGVFLDYLQLMGGGDHNRVQELSHFTRSLKALAREIDCPVFALSQLSRGVESRTNKRPMMSDLRESGAIEQDADLILMLYREEYYDPDTPDRGVAEVILQKHRNGPTGTVKLLFDAHVTTFLNRAASL